MKFDCISNMANMRELSVMLLWTTSQLVQAANLVWDRKRDYAMNPLKCYQCKTSSWDTDRSGVQIRPNQKHQCRDKNDLGFLTPCVFRNETTRAGITKPGCCVKIVTENGNVYRY